MARIKYDINLMNYMSLFESHTGAKLKDCIADDDKLLFIVQPGDMGRAIGKNGANIKKLEAMLRKSIRVVEFADDVVQFAKNCIYPLHADDISINENIIAIKCRDSRTRGLLIGRDRKNVNSLKETIGRHFDVKEITVA